jgi:hypothetical protein
MPILVSLAGLAHATCVDVPLELGTAERAIVDARLDDAGRSLERIVGAVGAPPASGDGVCTRLDPETVARFWIAEGAAASLGGSADAATRAFRAASRVDPDQWTTAFGPALRAEWEAAARLAGESGTIALEPQPADRSTWLDGSEVAFPTETADGLHLLQVGDDAVWGAIVLVPPGETFIVRVPDLPPIAPIEVAAAPAERPRTRRTAFLAGGAACLVAGGAFAWMAESKDDDIANAEDTDELDAARRSQQQLAAVSYGLLGLGAAGIVVGFAW